MTQPPEVATADQQRRWQWGNRIMVLLLAFAFGIYAWAAVLAVRRDRARSIAADRQQQQMTQSLVGRLTAVQDRERRIDGKLDRILRKLGEKP